MAHIIGCGAIHTALKPLFATPQISSSYDQGNLHAHVKYPLDAICNGLSLVYVNSKTRFSADCLSTQFKQDTFVFEFGHLRLLIPLIHGPGVARGG
jgi:hypothetical protein